MSRQRRVAKGKWVFVPNKDIPQEELDEVKREQVLSQIGFMGATASNPFSAIDGELHSSHRVKVMTPKGELGLFPREYSYIKEPQKYYEFIGDGMEMKFFGNEEGVPKDKLFYLRSRGISKKDALCMLIAEIKCHGVMWIEAARERLATV